MCFDIYSYFDRGVIIAFDANKVFESYSTDPGYIFTRSTRFPDFLARISANEPNGIEGISNLTEWTI